MCVSLWWDKLTLECSLDAEIGMSWSPIRKSDTLETQVINVSLYNTYSDRQAYWGTSLQHSWGICAWIESRYCDSLLGCSELFLLSITSEGEDRKWLGITQESHQRYFTIQYVSFYCFFSLFVLLSSFLLFIYFFSFLCTVRFQECCITLSTFLFFLFHFILSFFAFFFSHILFSLVSLFFYRKTIFS